MDQNRLTYLLTRYSGDTATTEEVEELWRYVGDNEDSELFTSVVAKLIGNNEQMATPANLLPFDSLARTALEVDKPGQLKTIPPVHRIHLLRTAWLRYAAAVVVLIGIGALLYVKMGDGTTTIAGNQTEQKVPDVQPGHDGAILTLADGRQVVLDSMGNGVIANQHGANVVLEDGRLIYNNKGAEDGIYNTLTTPRGRQFHLQLPDGSQVWLNAASSIRYPVAFTGNERNVEIKGEAYFEVTKNARMPFKVRINEAATVEVLGTSFNINAYDNEEAIKTTLLEGRVRLNAYKQLQTLKPGEQAVINASNGLQSIENADIEKTMAWKNGLFTFNGSDIQPVLREIARWYDLEVVYETTPRPRKIVGEMQRNLSLTQVMATIKDLDINYRLEGRKLIIIK